MSRTLTALGALCLTAACTEGGPLVPARDDPFVYVVLVPESGAALRALLLTTGSAHAMYYRTAQRFEMWRVSDGGRFDWRPVGLTGPAPIHTDAHVSDGNYLLPIAGAAGLLGAQDLAHGETYELLIESETWTIRGRTTIPGPVDPSVLVLDGVEHVAWRRVAAAAGYAVGHGSPAALVTDTIARVYRFGGENAPYVVQAIEQNAFAYLADTLLARSGVDAGFGVFGAVSRGEVALP